MNLPSTLLLRVLVPFLTAAAADRCLTGCGIREFETCGTAGVAPRAGPAVSAVVSPISASVCSGLSRLDAVPSAVPRDVTLSCEECVVLLLLVTS